MSATLDDATREEIYNAVFAKLPDFLSPELRQTAALDIIDEIAPRMNGRLGRLGNEPPEPIDGETEDDFLKRVDPTKLLVVPVETLPKLFDVQFPLLSERFREFCDSAAKWKTDHLSAKGGLIEIASDDENNELSDLMRQIRDFAGDDGEVDTTRKACKLQIFNGIKTLDAWFNKYRDALMAVHGPTKNPPLGSMQQMQTSYLLAKARREQQERDRLAQVAREESDRLAAAARRAAEEEEQRAAALRGTGVDEATATDISATVTDRAAEEADSAAVASALIGQAAAAPVRDMVRTHSALGSTTTLGGQWDVDETQVDMKVLCKAVADGDASETFVTLNLKAVRDAVRAKINPLRPLAGETKRFGITISETFSARRSGRR